MDAKLAPIPPVECVVVRHALEIEFAARRALGRCHRTGNHRRGPFGRESRELTGIGRGARLHAAVLPPFVDRL